MTNYAAVSTVDKPRLLKVFNFIAENPDRHNQGSWGEVTAQLLAELMPTDMTQGEDADEFTRHYMKVTRQPTVEITCGTTACVAGWTCLLAGDDFVIEADDDELANLKGKLDIEYVISRDNVQHTVGGRAMDLLGLDSDQADMMFDGNNSRSYLRAMVLALLNNEDPHEVDSYDHESEDIEPITYFEDDEVYA